MTFVVDVLGDRADLDRTEITAEGLTRSASLTNAVGGLRVELRGAIDPFAPTTSFTLTSRRDGMTLDTLEVTAFACQADEEFRARRDAGFRFEERYQVYLATDGRFDPLIHPRNGLLWRSCTATAPDGDGAGVATFLPDDARCEGSTREGTTVEMTRTADGMSIAPPLSTCWSLATQGYGPRAVIVGVTFEKTFQSPTFALQLSACIDRATTLPATLEAGTDLQSDTCPIFSGVVTGRYDDTGPERLELLPGGRWTVQELQLDGDDPHLSGDMVLDLVGPQEEQLSIRGHLRVPVIVEPSW